MKAAKSFDLETLHKGCQSIYDERGNLIFNAEWDSKALFETVTLGLGGADLSGKRALVMASNTSGLCLELARAGASVFACEPDPYKNSKAVVKDLLDDCVEREGLSLEFFDTDFFTTHELIQSDDRLNDELIIICFGIIYHFRDIIYALEYLGALPHEKLLISTQTHPTDAFSIQNRIDPEVIRIPDFWANHRDTISGWHFSRPLFEAYLSSVGYTDIHPITDSNLNFPRKPAGHTNSAYYAANHEKRNDFQARITEYLPR